MDYISRLKRCGLTTLETRRLRGDLIEVFKIMKGYDNINSNKFFELKDYKTTRGHSERFTKKSSRLDVRKYSFSQRVVNEWNGLDQSSIDSSSLNVFKNRLDKYLSKKTG